MFKWILKAIIGLLKSLARMIVVASIAIACLIVTLDLLRIQNFNPHKPHKVKLPEEEPTPSQESIDLAMKTFSIETYNCEYPKYDPRLTTVRGVMIPSGSILHLKRKVFIGPSAFESWGILGSTLAHELEVHCRQDLLLFNLKELLGMDGIREAEFEAYQHEIEQAHRFQLSRGELRSIQEIQKDFIK
jgi:hypothetical protein